MPRVVVGVVAAVGDAAAAAAAAQGQLKTMLLLLLLLFPQLLRWEQQPQRASMKEAMASKAPGPRRLDESGPRELDDIVMAIPVDALDGRVYLPRLDVLLTASTMSMQEVDANDGLRVREDLGVNSIVMIPSRVM